MKLHTYVIEISRISDFFEDKRSSTSKWAVPPYKGGGGGGGAGSTVPFPFLMNDTLNHAYPLYIQSGSQKALLF